MYLKKGETSIEPKLKNRRSVNARDLQRISLAEFSKSWNLYDPTKHTSPINYVQETKSGDPAEVRRTHLKSVISWMNNYELCKSDDLTLTTDDHTYILDLKSDDCDNSFTFPRGGDMNRKQCTTNAIIMGIKAGYSNLVMEFFALLTPDFDIIKEAIKSMNLCDKIAPGAYNYLMEQASKTGDVETALICSLLKVTNVARALHIAVEQKDNDIIGICVNMGANVYEYIS